MNASCFKPVVRLGLCAVLGSVALMVGCSGQAQPRAQVVSAAPVERTAHAAVYEFVIEAENPNDIELPMREVVYSFSIDGRRVFSATRDAQATMPRESTQTLTIPVVVPFDEVEPGEYRYRLSGRVYYSLPSQLADVLFDANLSRPNVVISDEGVIDLR